MIARQNHAVRLPDHATLKTWLIAAALAVGIVIVLFAIATAVLTPIMRRQAVQALEKGFHGKVDIAKFRVSIVPRMSATGENLTVRRGNTGDPPLIFAQKAYLDTGLSGLLKKDKHFGRLVLEGLRIEVPTGNGSNESAGQDSDKQRFLFDEVVADGSVLRILPKGGKPLEFDLSRLTVKPVGPDVAMHFNAALRIPVPPGQVETAGVFGPWQHGHVGRTALSGRYTLSNADLASFGGIGGDVSSEGTFKGRLQSIDVQGETETPDFRVTSAGHPVNLKTRFNVTVDATEGNVFLHQVDANFLHSSLVVQGGIAGEPGEDGKTISLDAKSDQARMEDLLLLALRPKPAVRGDTQFSGKLVIPAGDREVVDKLQIDAQFGVETAHMTSRKFQQGINKLSERARGDSKDDDPETVPANFQGLFTVRNGIARVRQISMQIPGATAQGSGTYSLRSDKVNVDGLLRMQAKVSETQKGVKALLAKFIDPIFKKKRAGAVLPVKVRGTINNPTFGLNLTGSGNAARSGASK